MGEIKIVKARGEDFERFYELFKETQLDGYFCYTEDSHRSIVNISLPEKALKEKVLNGELVGYLLTTKATGEVAFGHWLGVKREFQNQGVGSGLLEFWEKEELKKGSPHKRSLKASPKS
jgi:ribosomal protein S18 acetylase RimI-like enzyme